MIAIIITILVVSTIFIKKFMKKKAAEAKENNAQKSPSIDPTVQKTPKVSAEEYENIWEKNNF